METEFKIERTYVGKSNLNEIIYNLYFNLIMTHLLNNQINDNIDVYVLTSLYN